MIKPFLLNYGPHLIDLLIQHFSGELYILGYMINPHQLPNLRYLYKLVDFSRKH